MPRPTAAGVFGMARTIGVAAPSAASRLRIGVPAAMERKSVPPFPSAASRGSAAPIACGLTASTATAGSAGSSALRRSPARASALSRGAGFGSSTVTEAGGRPRASQPSRSAVPILPQPSRTSPRSEMSERSMPSPFRPTEPERGPTNQARP